VLWKYPNGGYNNNVLITKILLGLKFSKVSDSYKVIVSQIYSCRNYVEFFREVQSVCETVSYHTKQSLGFVGCLDVQSLLLTHNTLIRLDQFPLTLLRGWKDLLTYSSNCRGLDVYYTKVSLILET